MSEGVRTGLASQFCKWDHADVCIRFHLERSPEQQQEGRQEGAEGERTCGSDRQFVGDPLPAHTVILVLTSPFLKARLEKACWKRMAAGEGTQDGVAASDAVAGHRDKRQRVEGVASGPDGGCERASALPEVLVPLNSAAEVPFARQAIEYIYTGSLSADLSFEALLRVRQQACYLGVKHCPQACDQAMLAWLQAGKEQGQQQQHEGAGNSAGSPAAADLRVLQAYACRFLFPEPGTSPDAASFKPVRSTLAQQLVSHFGDAVAALTRPDLYQQLLQLPAVAVRDLLAADGFGTDSEDSVFLLLACWLEAHKGEEGKGKGVPAATRAKLCSLVRLHRLRPLYLNFVLPVCEPFSVCSRAELGCLLRYAAAGEHERTVLLDMDGKRRLSPWYCSPARVQVVPEEGRTEEWSISREQLEKGLREMVRGNEVVDLIACFGASAAAVGGGGGGAGSRVLADGRLWRVWLRLDRAASTAAAVYVDLTVPWQLGKVQVVAADLADVHVAVHSWAQGQRKAGFSGKFTSVDVFQGGAGRGWRKALTLPPAAAHGAGGGEASAADGVEAEVAAQLGRWSEWLHEGKITGSITFPRL